ncbi:MAG: dihydroxyacetone kinase [Eubacterium sp.]|jgi:dihydroxyacetone kinase-like protein|nr:dihydroxyacetone kinase [Eubacterium sp.]
MILFSRIKELFGQWNIIMLSNKEYLITIDSVVGDGDLGLTMSDGFKVAYLAVRDSEETDIGKLFYNAGKAMSTAVPSTMGTLMASGLMQAGKVLKAKNELLPEDIALLFEAYMQGVENRGKAKAGEKTFLDGLAPAVDSLQEDLKNGVTLLEAAQNAVKASERGSELTKTMIAVHGRAATRGEGSRELLDAGSVVAVLIMKGFLEFIKSIAN